MSAAPDPFRRRLLRLGLSATATAALPLAGCAAPAGGAPAPRRLRAAPARVSLLGDPWPDTDVWAYEGSVPGPLLRVPQGGTLRVRVVNDLAAPTSVHWHGVRLPNAMDGVPHVTQPPIAPRGGTFDYAFACPDAGTFWYHPHAASHVQVAMGLHGALIVDEPAPPAVDRDVLWVLDDWRLRRDGSVSPDFGSAFDATHAGRIGNTVTINGRLPGRFEVAPGERLRLRLLNVANARIFALRFEGHAPSLIATDGMPCEPHAPDGGLVVLGPGMRADVVLDCAGAPGATMRVVDEFVARDAYEVVTLAYGTGRRRAAPLRDVVVLPPNPVPAPDLARAVRHRIAFTGGMGGAMDGRGMADARGGRGAMRHAWAIDGRSATEDDHGHEPLLLLDRGATYVFEFVNDTAWWHPIHLHGHSFRLLSRNGVPLPRTLVADTTLVPPRSRGEVAFVADNPGDWMLHCHVLEHQASGMMATVRVA